MWLNNTRRTRTQAQPVLVLEGSLARAPALLVAYESVRLRLTASSAKPWRTRPSESATQLPDHHLAAIADQPQHASQKIGSGLKSVATTRQ